MAQPARRYPVETEPARRYPLPDTGGGGGGGTVVDAGGAQNFNFLAGGAALVLTNMPDADTEFNAAQNRRLPADLTGRSFIQAYCGGTVPAGAGSVAIVRWSLDGTTWNDFTTPCTVALDTLAAGTQTAIGTAVAIPLAAQGDVLLTVFTNGDATPTEDPGFILLGCLVT